MILKLSFTDREEFDDFFFGPEAEKEFIFDSIVGQIEDAIDNKKKNAIFAEIEFAGDPTPIYLEMPKKNWLESLNNALSFYEGEDLFEKCIKVTDIIKKLDSPKKKKSS
jgi:hypothetical protein